MTAKTKNKVNKSINTDGVNDNVDSVMRQYDRESNTRIWTGKPQIIVNIILAAFSLYAIYCALFAVMLDEVRLTSFIGAVVIMGYLTYPASKHHVRENYIPWYDILIMVLGTGAFLYFTLIYSRLTE